MHYYQFNIADYRKDTSHLEPIEHYIYRFLIDWSYLDETPIPLETQQVLRRLGLGSEYIPNLQNVLNDFFKKSDDGYFQKRINEEIEAYHNKACTSRENGRLGGRPKKPNETQQVNLANPEKPDSKVTNNYKQITNNHKTKISDNFQVSDYVKDWAIKNKYDLRMVEKHKNYFIAACKSSSYEKESWDDFFIKSMMDNWGGFSNPKGGVVL